MLNMVILLLPRVSATIKGHADFFAKEWPTSFDTWLPGGSAPEPNSNFRNPVLAETWKRIISESEAAKAAVKTRFRPRGCLLPCFVLRAIDGF